MLAAVQALAVLALVLSAAVALAAVWAGGVGVFTWGAIRLWVCLGRFVSAWGALRRAAVMVMLVMRGSMALQPLPLHLPAASNAAMRQRQAP